MEMYFPREEYEARWRKVDDGLQRRGLEAAVVWGRSGGGFERCGDVLYLTNYYGTHSGQGLDTTLSTARGVGAVLLRRGQEPELMADEPDPNPALIATPRIRWSNNTIRGIAELLREHRIAGPVGLVGSDFFPMKYWAQLQALTPDVDWHIEDELVREARLIKSPRELDAIRIGGATASRALVKLMDGLRAGKKEAEAAAEAAAEVVRGGGHVHMIPVNHGDQMHYFTRDPLNGYSQDAPRPGDLVRGWVYGPMFQGYWIDPGRTAVCGGQRHSNAQKHLVESCVGIVEQLIARIRPGITMGELAAIGDKAVADFGGVKDQAAEKWPHYGHGLGLFFEKPYISTVLGTETAVFAAGMVMGVEAFLSTPGVGSAGFEQNVIVTDAGAELITPAPSVWW
jgi:Xaa-Pro aminopeptidase